MLIRCGLHNNLVTALYFSIINVLCGAGRDSSFAPQANLVSSVLDQRQRKTFKRKNIEPIFGKVNEGNQIKKNNGQIARKVNESDKI